MLRLSREADYGIVLMSRIARDTDDTALEESGREPITTRDLAEESRITLPMVSKILKRLTRQGLLQSQRGAKGGYGLARPASAISVAEIIIAIEGPIGLTVCVDHIPGECDRESLCMVRDNFHLINQRVFETLSRISLTEMSGTLIATSGERGGADPIQRDDVRPLVRLGSNRTEEQI